MGEIRLVVSDMDGTLLDLGHDIGERNLGAIRRLQGEGIAFAISSGRPAEDVSRLLAAHGISCWISGCNGTRVMNGAYGRVVENHVFSAQDGLKCVEILLARNLAIIGFAGEREVLVHNAKLSDWQEEWMREVEEAGTELLVGREALIRTIENGELNKFLVFENPEEPQLFEAARELDAVEGVAITSSWLDNIELMPKGIDKGTFVAGLAGRLGLGPHQVMALGDQSNDLEMLAWAEHSVAMGNAAQEIKQVSRYVTGRCDESGFAQAIEGIVFGEGAAHG